MDVEPDKPKPPSARERLLQAAFTLLRTRGFTATSVDDLCAAAGVTKGAFFHHFPSKEALGVAASRSGRPAARLHASDADCLCGQYAGGEPASAGA